MIKNDYSEMKELYDSEPDKWVVYVEGDRTKKWWKLVDEVPLWYKEVIYKLIHKDDEVVADTVIANLDVEVEMDRGNGFHSVDLFATYNYKNEFDYRLKP